MGGWKDLREAKASRRAAENLPPVEDTLMVVSVMKASSINGADSDQNPGNPFHFRSLCSFFHSSISH